MENFKTRTEKVEKPFRVSDIYTSAFLVLSGLTYTLERKGNKILFCFTHSPDLYKALQAFNEGERVDAAEFTRELKRLRAVMYEARGVDDKGNEKVNDKDKEEKRIQ